MKVLTKAKLESCEAVLGVQLWRLYRISITQQRRKSVKQEIDSWHELGVEECRQAVERAFGNLARKAWRRKESDKHVCSQG
jgi:hypothetical protein